MLTPALSEEKGHRVPTGRREGGLSLHIAGLDFLLIYVVNCNRLVQDGEAAIWYLSRQGQAGWDFLCIGGAMLLTFYKEAEINLWSINMNLLHKGMDTRRYPTKKFVIQCSVLCWLCALAPPFHCNLLFGLRASRYAWRKTRVNGDWAEGTFASGAIFTFTAWCVQNRGALYLSIFSPPMLDARAGGSCRVLPLGRQATLGDVVFILLFLSCVNYNVLGVVVILCGLYKVSWGEGEELKRITQCVGSFGESERIEIIISCSAENSNINSSYRSNILVAIH
ncbi:hypothetical protein RHSIM_Rhsim11G0133900 [Rhododendron simsii]|uniref:Uncharacterized protein n=1 Tax=Rhododendron simsii TaxID=118357 RepID=A0A834G5T2_RHOSS|nr:hypothetical protein RHSIM_Rhsim11G0133900 [Rhododendron simsii]